MAAATTRARRRRAIRISAMTSLCIQRLALRRRVLWQPTASGYQGSGESEARGCGERSNYSYWHSATFSNDGSKVVFTDEWGGGLGARCRPNDPSKWGADAIFNLKDDKLSFANYDKLPAAQGDTENCVAHNGSLIPVPGRDIEVQAWYQGGVSVMDFTDPGASTGDCVF